MSNGVVVLLDPGSNWCNIYLRTVNILSGDRMRYTDPGACTSAVILNWDRTVIIEGFGETSDGANPNAEGNPKSEARSQHRSVGALVNSLNLR
jgi:hypothetical protein